MKKIAVIGHFGQGENLLNGQTIKTKIVTLELKKRIGNNNIEIIDTYGGAKSYYRLPFQIFNALKNCRNIIVFPGQNGVRVIVPLICVLNLFFKRKTHYVVIGGWLPAFLINKKILVKQLKQFAGIYVETEAMEKALKKQGFNNIYVMPNCKDLQILEDKDLIYNNSLPLRLCTFSRVMKEKGILDAVDAVKTINTRFSEVKYTLDIYGQIDKNQIEWFESICKDFPYYINYKGMIPYNRSTEVVRSYDAVLFPTYYEGEGFAGTIIDAMAAGVPVIASDWKYNTELISNGYNGVLFNTRNIEQLVDVLEDVYQNNSKWVSMKGNCLQEARKYTPDNCIKVLINMLA